MHTISMKIAISIPEDIFQKIEKISREQKISRSRVIAAAAREYIRKAETRSLMAKLDAVYSEPETRGETDRRKAMAAYQRRRLKRNEP